MEHSSLVLRVLFMFFVVFVVFAFVLFLVGSWHCCCRLLQWLLSVSGSSSWLPQSHHPPPSAFISFVWMASLGISFSIFGNDDGCHALPYACAPSFSAVNPPSSHGWPISGICRTLRWLLAMVTALAGNVFVAFSLSFGIRVADAVVFIDAFVPWQLLLRFLSTRLIAVPSVAFRGWSQSEEFD